MKVSNIFIFIVVLFLTTQIFYGQSPYRYDVIATSSSSLVVYQPSAINNNGEVAFSGRTTSGVIFTDYLPNQPRAVSTLGSIFFPGQIQINDSRQILSQ